MRVCVEAKFKRGAIIVMALFFSLTTLVRIAIGTMISGNYKEESPTTLIMEGILNATSISILIYMSLVDLLASEI